MNASTYRRRARGGKAGNDGFSLLEALAAVAIMMIMIGPVLYVVQDLQKQNLNEANKLDVQQEAREYMDEVIRDLHQSGTPNVDQFDPASTGHGTGSAGPVTSCTGATINGQPSFNGDNCSFAAVGLVRLTDTDLWFEGDVDGDGTVNVVRYTLYDNSGSPAETGSGSCPCTLKRSEANKVGNTAGSIAYDDSTQQTGATSYNTELQNVVNSFDSTRSTPKTIAGTVTLSSNGLWQTVNRDNFYSAYKGQPIFAAFKSDGTRAAAVGNSGYLNSDLLNIKTIRITINILGPTGNTYNNQQPAISFTADSRVGNN